MISSALGLLISVDLIAVEVPEPPGPIQIRRAAAPITLHGDLSDSGWQNAAVIDHFYETWPANNTAPKVQTVAYLTYDAKYFYVGVRADDPEPSRIRAPYVERDAVLGSDDNIAIFLDTRNDHRSAIELRVNPRGIQGDAIFNDANGNENFSPDFFFDSVARIGASGWSAEFRIPFSSLRYGDTDPQTWNILISRNYPRDFRYTIQSAPIPRQSTCLICHAHPITGLTGLPRSGHTVAAPYVSSQQRAEPASGRGARLRELPIRTEMGADIKWNPTADHALDLTFNPDFSQVESDVAQITANQRFAIFFPEKRPFFLEGFDLFDTPIQVAYTRTITSPRWGVRGTGKVASTSYTMLLTQDRGGGLVILPGPSSSRVELQDASSYALISRVRHDFGSSFIGGVLTDREVRGGGHNRIIGPDFQWRPTNDDALTGQILYSDTKDLNRSLRKSWGGDINWVHQAPHLDYQARLKDIGTAFRADNGFLPQVGYREFEGNVGLRSFPTRGLFNFVRTYIWTDAQADQHGAIVFQKQYPGIYLEGRRGLIAGFAIHPRERYRVGDALLSETFAGLHVEFNPSRRLPRVAIAGMSGQSIDFVEARVGHGSTLTVEATIRSTDRLTIDLHLDRQWLNDHGQRLFTARVQRLKAIYSFSDRSLIRAIGQYTSTTTNPSLYATAVSPHSGGFDGSLLYGYKVNWQTVFFLGYGDARVLDEQNQLLRSSRSLFLKVSYALQR
jgi:uncharacterized protein DUF5916